MKDLALTIITVLITLAALFVFWQLHSIVLLFLFSIIIAAVLRAPIDHLITHRWPRWLAMLFVYSTVCLSLVVLALMISLALGAEIELFAADLFSRYERGYGLVQTDMFSGSAWFNRLPPTELVGELLLGDAQSPRLINRVLGFTQNFAYFVGQAVLAIVISIYWAADEKHFERLLLSLLAPVQRKRMRNLWYKLESNVGAYIRSEVSQSVLAGALLTLGFWVMGFPYPFIMATIGAFAWFIPIVGAFIAIMLIGLLAVLHGTGVAIAAIGFTIVVFLFLEFLVEPRLYPRNQYGVILVIIVMMAMIDAFGLLGLLLAPPLALSVQIGLEELLSAPLTPSATTAISLAEIEEQLQQVQSTIAITEVESPRITSMVARLEELMEQAKAASQSAMH